MSHPSDEQLAAFVDNDSNDSNDGVADVADIAAHVAQCERCQQQVTALRGVVAAVHMGPQPSVVDAVLRRIEAPSWWSRWRVPMLAAASCAVIAGFVFVRAPTPTTNTDVFIPRGGHGQPRVLQLLNDGRAIVDGADVAAGSSWRADLQADGEAIAVVAIDVDGAVHWLRPTWTDAARPPACPAPVTAMMSIATETVAFALPTGPLIVRALRVPSPCDVPRLDAALSAGGTGGAVVVDEVRVMVRP